MNLIKLKIKNLKCLKDIEIPIHKFNLLIGENDSGKSTVLEALNIVLNDEKPNEDDFFKDNKGNISKTIEVTCIFELNDEEQNNLREFSYNKSELQYKKVLFRDIVKNFVFAKKYTYNDLNLNKTKLNKKKAAELDVILNDLGIEFKKGEAKNLGTRIQKIIEFRENAEFTYHWVEIKKELKNYLPKFIKYDTNDYQSPESMVYKTLQIVFDSFIYNFDEDSGTRTLITNLEDIIDSVKIKFDQEIKKLLPYIKKYNESITDVAIRPDIDFSKGLRQSSIELKNKYGTFPLEEKGEGTKKRLFLSFLEWDREVLTELSNTIVIRGYDEPDTSLHYEAQRKLFNNILEVTIQPNSNIQALICTHSLTMINRAKPIDIYHLYLDNKGITNIQYLKSFEDEDIESYLTELSIEMGLPNSSLFFERCFLIVEGDTEEHCLPKLYYKKFKRRFIEDGICIVNVKGIGNAKGFIKLLGKNKKKFLLFLLDSDCNNPDSKCRLSESELKEIGFDSTFIRKKVYYIGNKEFEDSFENKTIIKVLNTYWEKQDSSLWDDNSIIEMKKEGKFSKVLLIKASKYSKKKGIERFTKPKFGEKLGELCEIDDYPKVILKLFEEARKISKI